MDKSLELEFAKFETEVARTEMYGTMLGDALNMYNYVRYNGINRTFARLYGDNISSLLNRPIDINTIPVVGSPRDKLSLLFLVAMEDDATAGTGAATTAGGTTTATPTTGTTTTTGTTATGTNTAPAANNAKQQGIFSKIWAFIRRILNNIMKFFKGVFRKAMGLLVLRRKQIDDEMKRLDLKNMKDVDVRVMDYKQVHHDFKRWYAAGLKVAKIAQNLEQNIKSNPTELTKLSAEAKAAFTAELKNDLKGLSDENTKKAAREGMEKAGGPLVGAGNPKFVNSIVTEINAVVNMIKMIQTLGTDLGKLIEDTSKPINDELARLENNKNPSADDKLKLNAYRQAAQVLLDMTKFAEKMTSWNGKKADGVLKDLQNLGKAAGVEPNNPTATNVETASTEMAAEAQAEKKINI